MDITINEQKQQIHLKGGRSVLFSYDSIIDLAGMNPIEDYNVRFEQGDFSGCLSRPYGKVALDAEIPAFFTVEKA